MFTEPSRPIWSEVLLLFVAFLVFLVGILALVVLAWLVLGLASLVWPALFAGG